jgi:Ca2+-binding EF-hand superfamily protein
MEAYSETMSIDQAEATVQHIMEQVDSDGSGFIDYSEFVLACSNQQTVLSKVNLEAAFAAFDRDRSGKISANELREMLGAAHPTSNSVWDDLIRQADQNGDGEIEYQEFAKLMLSAA